MQRNRYPENIGDIAENELASLIYLHWLLGCTHSVDIFRVVAERRRQESQLHLVLVLIRCPLPMTSKRCRVSPSTFQPWVMDRFLYLSDEQIF